MARPEPVISTRPFAKILKNTRYFQTFGGAAA